MSRRVVEMMYIMYGGIFFVTVFFLSLVLVLMEHLVGGGIPTCR